MSMLNDPRANAAPGTDTADRIPAYSWYLLAVLFLVGVCNFVDRQILLMLIEPIREDLNLSDTQIGLLTGFSFAVVYATGGVLIARLADRTSRRMVLGVTIIVWSAMTALGGLAQSFWQLAATRLGVAAGEAGATPSAHGLISAHFPAHRHGMALSIFATSTSVGTMLGFMGGGWLVSHFPWRSVLIMVGLPGILLGILVLMTIRDGPHTVVASPAPSEGAIRRLLSRPAFRQIMLAFMFVAIAGNGFASFQAPFLIRLHGFDSASAGLAMGLLYGVGGGLGTLAGGLLADRLGRRDPRWRLRVPAIGFVISAVFMAAALSTRDGTMAVLLMIIPTFAGMLYLAPTFGVAQSLAAPSSRSTASALLLFAAGLIGGGVGPLLMGAVSDLLSPSLGVEGLRYAVFLLVPIQLLAALHFFLGSRRLPDDLAKPPA